MKVFYISIYILIENASSYEIYIFAYCDNQDLVLHKYGILFKATKDFVLDIEKSIFTI